ncbi:MAG: DUF2135 domain-containing protein [Saonia sp.]
MKNATLLILFLSLSFLTFSQQQPNKIITGKMTYLDIPLTNAQVVNTNSKQQAKSNLNGNYSIKAGEGDILLFQYPSMKDMEIVVEDITAILNIKMNQEVNKLDEVVVSKTRNKSQEKLQYEYASNKNLINTAFGIVDRDLTNFPVRVVDGSELPLGQMDFVSTIQFRFPNLRVIRPLNDPTRPIVYLRGGTIGLLPVIYDVDGLIFTEAPTFIMVENIERIAVMSGLGLVTKYGGQSNGGVIVINTKGANYFPEPGTDRPYDQAKRRNNIFEDKVLTSNELKKNSPTYLQQLHIARTAEEAMDIYKVQVNAYRSSYHYMLDAHSYFKETWGEMDFADKIIKDHWYLFQENPVALKSLAYSYQASGDFEKANEIFKEVFIIRPHYAQSYMDLANSYREIGNYRKAASLYTRYDYLIAEGFIKADDKGFTDIIRNDFNNLLKLNGKNLVQRQRKFKRKDKKDAVGTRMVFEWSDSEAEFELQFVNPQNQYYKWNHSLLANAERIKDGKLKGYSCQEYVIDDSLKGSWQVNVNYFGNKSLTPSYLKATIYHNYGLSSQRKETRVFKLSVKDVSQPLFTISNASTLASK